MRISDWSSDVCSSDLATLRRRFPGIVAPKGEDICYATSNRQASVKAIAPACDLVLVIGAPNSSNSLRLVEVAEREGTPSRLIQRAGDIDLSWLTNVSTLRSEEHTSELQSLMRSSYA